MTCKFSISEWTYAFIVSNELRVERFSTSQPKQTCVAAATVSGVSNLLRHDDDAAH